MGSLAAGHFPDNKERKSHSPKRLAVSSSANCPIWSKKAYHFGLPDTVKACCIIALCLKVTQQTESMCQPISTLDEQKQVNMKPAGQPEQGGCGE